MKKIILFIVMSGVLLLAACGGGDTSIAIGPPASETNSVSKLIFEAYGITEDDYSEYQEGFGDAADMVQDGNIDISVGILGVPAGSIESLQASAGNVKMISLTEDAINYMEENSGYLRYTIPAETYDFLEEDVETVTAYAVLMGNTDTIDEEMGYELAKSMIENAEDNTHAQSEHMILENALSGSEGLPIHPGAKRYYEEQGLTVDNPVAELNVNEEKSDFILGTGSQGGTYYPLGGEMATIWNNTIDGISVTNTETGASIENLVSIRDGNMDLGMTVHVPAQDAINGDGDFEDNEVTNAAFIGHIYPEVVQIVTLEDSGIEGFEEIAK
ncbi:TAXI family TRAP transporter solute-binding subunit [Oceanobacillus jeddahense]|uniref:TAXI family TRAP transporter solute-binding subunit n=1 Tax=Oceanobacillus jeddahense TaxID=1462527 RepID=UPI000595AFF8|nr:TAXI family TRAP transporter solute-binding subunit [Oceanobacillus jeddahense]